MTADRFLFLTAVKSLMRKTVWIAASVSSCLLSSCHDGMPDFNPAGNTPDNFQGTASELILGPETAGFDGHTFTLALEAPDGTVIRRTGLHERRNIKSHLKLSTGLSDGIYRLLYLEYPITDNPALKDLADLFSTTQYGLGSRIEIKDGVFSVLDYYNEEIGLPGRGTAEEPYEISSYQSLIRLASIVNNEETNELITKDTHFRQTGKIDMYQASREADRRYGWLPIGAVSSLPFRGHYHGAALSTLIIDRPNSAAVGLFGYVHNAEFSDIKLSNSAISGNFAAGGIAGASLMSGTERGLVTITGCEVSECEITGSDESVSVGAFLGAVDMQSRAYFQNCTSRENGIKASYNAGGFVGGSGLYSSVAFSSCRNNSSVTSDYSGVGGLIGSCDTVQVTASSNSGRIVGASRYAAGDTKHAAIGAGGLVGGTGTATVTSSSNTGTVSGYAGVGGLVGSSRVKGSDTEAYMYNNVMCRYSWNEGSVTGTEAVGGITGEAQAGTYAVYNKGNISGTRYVAGIAGCTSIAVTHNAVNLGKISGTDYVAGVVGKTTFGSLALDHNYGEVSSTGTHMGGITALAGNNTVIHYCGNYGSLNYSGKGPVGGIVGEIGDPRKWTAMNITECVIGSAEVVMGILGPVMAVVSPAIEELSETLEIFLHVTETSTDGLLLITDAILWQMGLEEMIGEAGVTHLSETLTQEVTAINNDVKSEMGKLRRSSPVMLHSFNSNLINTNYADEIDKVLAYYESGGGDLKFNEKINVAREEREEALEKKHKTDEIIHQVVSGVCIVVSTVAAIGGLVATGGAALPFVLAGSVASVAGGLNAITKSCLEFEENAVIISQCINAGNISSTSGSDIGGIVGRLQDNSIIRDCLNTGDGPGHGYPFVGKTGNAVIQQRLLSLCEYSSWSELSTSASPGRVIWNPDANASFIKSQWDHHSVTILNDKRDVADPATYSAVDKNWAINSAGALWSIPGGLPNSFPVLSRSEMTE